MDRWQRGKGYGAGVTIDGSMAGNGAMAMSGVGKFYSVFI
jgi:hypothetical protein